MRMPPTPTRCACSVWRPPLTPTTHTQTTQLLWLSFVLLGCVQSHSTIWLMIWTGHYGEQNSLMVSALMCVGFFRAIAADARWFVWVIGASVPKLRTGIPIPTRSVYTINFNWSYETMGRVHLSSPIPYYTAVWLSVGFTDTDTLLYTHHTCDSVQRITWRFAHATWPTYSDRARGCALYHRVASSGLMSTLSHKT